MNYAMTQAMPGFSECWRHLRMPCLGLLALFWLSGCAAPLAGVPVDDRGRGGSQASINAVAAPASYLVQRGDTLYQIAFRFGMDWRDLAAVNRISAPFTIYPGQTLQVAAAPVPATVANRSHSSRPPVAGRPTPAVTATRSPVPAPTASPARTPVITLGSAPSAPTPSAAPVPAPPAAAPAAGAVVKGWTWPAQGPLIARFNSNGSLNKGIDIAGNLGQPVRAAAEGSVVYAGQGLLGYGEMLIIKHDDVYLSAYAHNSRLRVKEGDRVKAGDVIAEMGSSGTDRVKLHFEIRRRGQPVDPLTYLPKQ